MVPVTVSTWYAHVLWPMSRVSEFGHRGRVRKATRDLVEDGTAIEAGEFECRQEHRGSSNLGLEFEWATPMKEPEGSDS